MMQRVRFSVSFSLLGLLAVASGCSEMSRVELTKNSPGEPTVLEGAWASVCYPVELEGNTYSARETVVFRGNSANSVVRKYEELADCSGEGIEDVQETSGSFSILEEQINVEGKDLIEVESTFTRSLSLDSESIGITYATRRYFHVQGDRMYVANDREDDKLEIESEHYWVRQ